METKEIMANEDVMETVENVAEEIVETGSGCGLKMAAGVGIGVLAGMAICKLAKPITAKIKKAWQKRKSDVVEAEITEETEVAEEESPGKSK